MAQRRVGWDNALFDLHAEILASDYDIDIVGGVRIYGKVGHAIARHGVGRHDATGTRGVELPLRVRVPCTGNNVEFGLSVRAESVTDTLESAQARRPRSRPMCRVSGRPGASVARLSPRLYCGRLRLVAIRHCLELNDMGIEDVARDIEELIHSRVAEAIVDGRALPPCIHLILHAEL